MHELRCPHNIAAIDLTNALMAEAHTKHRHATSEVGDDLVGKACIFWSARAGADEYTVGGELFDLFDAERVAAMHEGVGSQFAQVLDEIEDERVVVIEDKDAGGHRRRTLSAETGRA